MGANQSHIHSQMEKEKCVSDKIVSMDNLRKDLTQANAFSSQLYKSIGCLFEFSISIKSASKMALYWNWKSPSVCLITCSFSNISSKFLDCSGIHFIADECMCLIKTFN
jgi:hypothetical protein